MVWWMLAMGQAEAGPTCGIGVMEKDTLVYVSGARAAEKEAERAKVEARAPNPTPTNGIVAVIVERNDLEGAHGSNHIVTIEQAGTIVTRYEAPPIIPTVPDPPYDWRNVFEVPIPDGVSLPITVRAIDKELQKACVWDISADGKVGKPRKE